MISELEGHEDVARQFRRSLARGRLGSTFLFVGPAGIGKRMFAEKLAAALLCNQVPAEELAPCGQCESCRLVASHTHPDLHIVEKPPGKSSIPLALLLGDDERRMREGLCHDIALKPFMGGRRVAIIDDADYLAEESANCLLKTLEEPPPASVLILIGTSADKQLPTIRSRCQIIRFRPLDRETVKRILLSRGLVEDQAQAERLSRFADGSVERALELADDELWKFRAHLLDQLARDPLASVALAQTTVAFVEAAGKDAAPRRDRARQVVQFAIDFYRQVLRAAAGLSQQADEELASAVSQAQGGAAFNPEAMLAAIDRSLETLNHIDRNAHQSTLVECWFDDLARIYETSRPIASYSSI